ncbi:MAG: hypothetical protein WBD37_05120 [Anderseniella sp.]
MSKFALRAFGALTLVVVGALGASAADLDIAYNDAACLTPSEVSSLGSSRLASAIGADVAGNSSCAQNACNIATSAGANQSAVGAGLAQAYNQFASQGDIETAGSIADVACTCGGSVGNGFSSGAGSACSIANGSENTYGGYGTVGNLFYIRSSGGGGGGQPISPN